MKLAPKSALNEARIRVGVSSCLLGLEVRFDGGHKRNEFLVETFGRFVEFVPVCPEFELGLGVPRESLRLERKAGEIRMVGNETGTDVTGAMRAYAARRVHAFETAGLSGYVLKKDSPSCGMERVRVYAESGMPSPNGRGIFAAALIERHPNLPVEEEERFIDPNLREHFIERVFAYRRLTKFFSGSWTTAGLIVFHTAHSLQLSVHSQRIYAELGRLVAAAEGQDRAVLRRRYEARFMTAFAKIATTARHVNVLQHIAGYFRDRLDPASLHEWRRVIRDYRVGLVPLIVPITLARHYAQVFGITDLKGQIYLEQQPQELMLRHRV